MGPQKIWVWVRGVVRVVPDPHLTHYHLYIFLKGPHQMKFLFLNDVSIPYNEDSSKLCFILEDLHMDDECEGRCCCGQFNKNLVFS